MSEANPRVGLSDRFEVLKDILLDDNNHTIEELQREIHSLRLQLSEKQQLLNMLDPILTELLDQKIANSRGQMARTLAPVISVAIKHQIINAKEDVVDALYPIVGQLVRRAVQDAMKGLVENINRTMSTTFDKDLWVKRLKARFTNISEAEIILAHAAPFELNSVYVIYKESGLLISFLDNEGASAESIDAQVIGGMLTAIRSFVSNAFSSSTEENLKELELEQKTIRIYPGRYSYLAVEFSGIWREDFDGVFIDCQNKMHKRYYRQLRAYDGDNAKLQGIHGLLKDLFKRLNSGKLAVASS